MKNLIYIPATNGIQSELPYGIKSWEYYCKKYDIQLIISNELPPNNNEIYKNVNFQQYLTPTLEEEEYDRLLIVDCDTMIRWDAPNIFNKFHKHTFTVVKDISGENSGRYHLNQWLSFNPNIKTPPQNYFNSGFILTTKDNYLKLKKHIKPYYDYYIDVKRNDIHRIDTSDQTPTNILAYELFEKEIQFLPDIWNNMVMFKYDDASFINDSYIWHFTGPKMGGWGNKKNIMKSIWDAIHSYYV